MRKETRFALGIVGLSAVATSYLVGHQPAQSSVALATSAVTASSNPTPSAEVTPTQTNASAATEPTPTQSVTPEKTTAPSATTDPTPTATAADGTYLSTNVSYRYGNIQLEVTVQSGHLAAINLLQATTHGRGYDQAPPMLVDAALQAGSADFGNLSGATFTSMAFKQALTDALNQAGL